MSENIIFTTLPTSYGYTSFSGTNGTILTITPDGKLVRGEGFASDDAASVAFFDCLVKALGMRNLGISSE